MLILGTINLSGRAVRMLDCQRVSPSRGCFPTTITASTCSGRLRVRHQVAFIGGFSNLILSEHARNYGTEFEAAASEFCRCLSAPIAYGLGTLAGGSRQLGGGRRGRARRVAVGLFELSRIGSRAAVA